MFNGIKHLYKALKILNQIYFLFCLWRNLSPTVEELLKSTLSSELGISMDENRSISEIASPNFFAFKA
ncbi:MAG: hypothetical protein CM15mP12_0150 [Gammaproteobacteria bacterium]|nr:MAG: hypothetical protein CM15mP12_0150 [Gammaproteobacteria bacterium]